MTRDTQRARLARVIASDLVAYFRAEGSPFAGSEPGARELASQGLTLLRTRFGDDEALERYYADCIGSAFGSLMLQAPALDALRAAPPAFVERHPPHEDAPVVIGRGVV